MDKTLPYEKIVNKKLGRTLTPDEIEAVKVYVEYGNGVSPSSQYFDNAVRSVIAGGAILDLIEFSKQPLWALKDLRDSEVLMQRMTMNYRRQPTIK